MSVCFVLIFLILLVFLLALLFLLIENIKSGSGYGGGEDPHGAGGRERIWSKYIV